MHQKVVKNAAARGPIGVAIHTHHTVAAFHRRNVRAAHPAMRRQSRADAPYDELIASSGTSATSNAKPLPPSYAAYKPFL